MRSSRKKSPSPTIVVDLQVVQSMVERTRVQIAPEDHACMELVLQALREMSRLLSERGTAITRMRRIFGLRTTEKFSAVFPGAPKPANDEDPMIAGDGDSSAELSDDERDERGTPDDRRDGGAGTADDRAPTNDPDGRNDSGNAKADAPRPRKGHGRIAAAQYPHAPRIHVEHDRMHVGDDCPGCSRGTLYPLREPHHIVRIVGQAPLAARAWEIDRLRCSGCGDVFAAPAPAEARGPKYDESAVAMMALLRYGAGMPLHRLAQLQRNLETPVPASTQWEVVRDHVDVLQPVHDALCRHAASGRVLHNDDTSVRILEFMGKRRAELLERGELPDPDRTGLFTTGIVSITEAGPVALFCSGRKHGGENFASLLQARTPGLPPPIHMCDGLDRNRPRGHVVVEDNCLAHGRRHVVDEVDNFPDECQHVLEALGKVFKTDEECRKRSLSDDERLTVHRRESEPVMAELHRWITAQLDDKRIEPNSGLGGAFQYLLKRWDKLTLFLRVAGAPLDNNIAERVLKMAIRHRSNSLFYRSARGARVADVYMALIYTAELHGVNPFEYLIALLVHAAEVAAAPTAWLPWTFRATLARGSAATA